MENKLNDEPIQGPHNFGINGTNFTVLQLSGYEVDTIKCFFFKNPEQSKLDEIFNGKAYLFYSLDFLEQEMKNIKPFKSADITF